ncbi:hypothetical protein M2163_000662 [Streptomyces sp. SAI-135]|nr:hypothetical protein [Streptomyces sp. SAI-135]
MTITMHGRRVTSDIAPRLLAIDGSAASVGQPLGGAAIIQMAAPDNDVKALGRFPADNSRLPLSRA